MKKASLFSIFLTTLGLISFASTAQDTSKMHVDLSFTEWYVSGLKENPDAAFSFASRTGIQGCELRANMEGDSLKLLKSKTLRLAYLDAAVKYGMKISSFCLGDLNNAHPLKSDIFGIKMMQQCIDLCVLMKVKVILIPLFFGGDIINDPKGLDVVISRLKIVAPKAESLNVVLGIESYLSGEDNIKMLQKVGSKAVQVYYDIGNSQQRGYDIYKEIRLLKELICSIHIKDYTGLFGKGKIDFFALQKALADINYNGWMVLELDQNMVKPLSHEQGYKANAVYLKTIFNFTGIVGISERESEKLLPVGFNPLLATSARILPVSFKQQGPAAVYISNPRADKSSPSVLNIRGQIVPSR